MATCVLLLVYGLAFEFLGRAGPALLAVACVSVVGGWDVIPDALRWLTGGSLVVTLDAWCPTPWRMHNFTTQYLWCAQHVSAVVALLLAVRWLQRARGSRAWLIVAPALGAFIFGTSVYLAITIFAAAGMYVLGRLWALRREVGQRGRFVVGVGVIALLGLVLMLPQAWHYHIMNGRFPGGLTTAWERFPYAALGRLLPPGPWANWLDVPWLLLTEIGLGALALLLVTRAWWRGVWREPGGRLLVWAAALGPAAMYTVHSDINPIDYGFRVSTLPTMVLTALAAGALLVPALCRLRSQRVVAVVVIGGVLLGLPVGLWEAPLAAVRSFVLSNPQAADAEALRAIRTQTPVDAVVQGDPSEARLNLLQLAHRQLGVLDPDNPHVVVFRPPDIVRCARRMRTSRPSWGAIRPRMPMPC